MYAVENHNLVSNYAIVDKGAVINIIWLAKENLLEFPDAVEIGELPVAIGDVYSEGKFFRNNEEVKTPLTLSREDNAELTNLLGEATQSIYNSDMEAINNV